MGRPIPPTDQRCVWHAFDAVRQELDATTWDRLLAEGREMPLAQAVDAALMPSDAKLSW